MVALHEYTCTLPNNSPIPGRMCRILLWTYTTDGSMSSPSVLHWLRTLVKDKPCLVSRYTLYLKKQCTDSTVRIWLLNLGTMITWFTKLRDKQLQPKFRESDMQQFRDILKKECHDCRKGERHHRSKVTVETMLQSGLLPSGGIRELQVALEDGIKWVNEESSSLEHGIDEEHYYRMLEVLVCGLYLYSAQGRVGGLMHLQVRQSDELLNRGYTLSSEFKTQAAFGYQPVILPDEIRSVFVLYLLVRAKIVNRTGSTCLSLFLQYNGERIIRLGTVLYVCLCVSVYLYY